jgi:hypothetical protein
MTKVFVDASGQVRLDELREPVEICSPDGRTLGVFCPMANPAKKSPYSIEELERLRKVKTGRTLAEIREDLNKRGIPF